MNAPSTPKDGGSSPSTQRSPESAFRPAPDPEVRRRYRGCLLGGAVGDALGAPVEFMSRAEIVGRFGPEGITDFTTAFERRGAITDDTQMTLFTAEGLLRAHVREAGQGSADRTRIVSLAYLRWLKTQGRGNPLLAEEGGANGWLLAQKGLHALRVPGNTCLQALGAMRVAGARARNESKGCGGVMRVAPVGLYCARAPGASVERVARTAFDVGVECAALTHGHPTGQVAAGAFAAMVAQLARGEPLSAAIARVEPMVARRALGDETAAAIGKARALAAAGPADPSRVSQLGEGWVADEALAIAVYAALAAPDFTAGVRLAVNHDGDSDSTGAIAGNLLGAIHGIDAIPRKWLSELELGDVVVAIADDLATYPEWPVGEFHPHDQATSYWLERYPP